MFKKFHDKRTEMNLHMPKDCQTPLINVLKKLKEFIAEMSAQSFLKNLNCEMMENLVSRMQTKGHVDGSKI